MCFRNCFLTYRVYCQFEYRQKQDQDMVLEVNDVPKRSKVLEVISFFEVFEESLSLWTRKPIL